MSHDFCCEAWWFLLESQIGSRWTSNRTPSKCSHICKCGVNRNCTYCFITAQNNLQVKASDIQNAYLTSACAEKIFTVLGIEFGADASKTAIIVRALYSLKSACASFQRHKSCMADAEIWWASCETWWWFQVLCVHPPLCRWLPFHSPWCEKRFVWDR